MRSFLFLLFLPGCSEPPIQARVKVLEGDTSETAVESDPTDSPPTDTDTGPTDSADSGTHPDTGADSGTPSEPRFSKSSKRGIAYNLTDPADFAALETGVSWSANWYFQTSADPSVAAASELEFIPMLWGYNGESDYDALETWLLAHPETNEVLVMNEPNLVDQANMTPATAVSYWRRYEQFRDDMSSRHGRTIRIIGPAMTWGTLPGYSDPVVWMDAFLEAFEAAHGRPPHMDALAFHWYDYGLDGQLDRLEKYGLPFWVTEMANWHTAADWTIDTEEKQIDAMVDMVRICEERADVERYAWFIGRWDPDPHHTSLFTPNPGELTALGAAYLEQPWTAE